MLIHQRTLKKEASLSGTGLHTGKECRITFKPAPAGYGYRFIRTDVADSPEIPALIDNVVEVLRGTTIGIGGVKVHTTEHVLGALYGLQVDNCRIEMDGPEPPVMTEVRSLLQKPSLKQALKIRMSRKTIWS